MRRASLNHTYRLVWSDHAHAYVAVAEGTRARGKSKLGSALVVAIAQWFAGANAYADGVVVAPGSGGTNVYNAPNGVPVINIDKANAAGLSHNKYLDYNVGTNGLILNNGNSSQIARQSELAGQIIANTNLSAQAKFILNEVVSSNPSQLLGYTEVLGGKADVIIANPYGITCSGCGFINTDRVTLTTGTVNLLGSGAIGSFTVGRGDILINGKGLDASNQSYFELVTRSLKVDGQVNAKTLQIVVGTNTWDYATRAVTVNAATGAAPAYAFDSTVLGGMYANRISIKSTEAGVGVRMLGESAATADDFTINAAGKLEIRSKVSAERDLSLTSTSAATGAITLSDAELTAKRNLELTAQNGNASVTGGLMVAGNNLTGVFGSLNDTGSSATITDNNKRYATGATQLTVTNGANLNGTNWGAKGNLTVESGSMSIGAGGASLYSDAALKLRAATGNLALATAAVQAVNNIELVATAGQVSTTAGSGQGIKTTAGNISINTETGLSNAGVIAADAGSVTLRANGNSSNSGTIYAKTDIDMADKYNTATANISNSGTVMADDTLTIKANSLTNSGSNGLQARNGSTIQATTLTNSANLITSTVAGKSGSLTVGTLNNSGTVQSAEDLTLNVSGSLTNSGKLIARHDLSVLAAANAVAISNTLNAVIQADNALKLTGNQATLNTQAGKVLGNTVDLTLSSISNSGTVQSEAAMTYQVANALTNSGTLLAKGALTGSSDSLSNSGTLQANAGATLTAANAITNTGTLIGSDSSSAAATLNASTLSNSGTIQSKQHLTVNLSGNSLSNAGKLLADDDLTIDAKGSGLTINNQNGGFIQAGTATGDELTIKGNTVTLNNNSGATLLADRLDLTAAAMTNAGTVQGGSGASSVTISNTLSNTGTFSLANTSAGSGSITADTLNNSGTLQSGGAANLNVATALTNSNKILATGGLTVRGTDSAYTVENTGRMQSGGLLDIKGQGAGKGVDVTIGSTGVMFGNTVDMKAGTLTINNGGMLTSTANLNADLDTLRYGGTSARIVGATAGGTTAITLVNDFENPGILHSGGTLSMTGAGITNTSTGGISGNTVTLAGIAYLYNAGAIYANNQLTVSSTGSVENQSSGTMDSSGSISLTAATLLNYNSINALQDITISATNFTNAYQGLESLTRAYDSDITWGDKVLVDTVTDGTPVDITQYYEKTGTKREYFLINGNKTYDSPIPNGAIKPQIISGRNMTISGFSNAKNIGGVLAASSGVMNITGTGTFINDDLSLNTKSYKATWNDYIDTSIGFGGTTVEVTRNRSYEEHETGTTSQTFGTAGVFAQTLNASGFDLVNKSAAFAATVGSKSATGTTADNLSAAANGASAANGVSGTTTASGAPAISFGGLVIALPTNPNGYFVLSQDPNAKFLVETNPLFNVGADYIGSDYMAKRLGLNPDLVGLRLGDAAYETQLIRQQLIAQTGKNILNGFASENAMIEQLYQNAANAAGSLGLTWGQPLSPAQIANLKQDVVWMVETVVAGKKVLSPVVYLAKATVDTIQTGAVIAANKTNLDLNSVTNTGGTIAGKESLTIKSVGDVTNEGGTLKGGNVSITSTAGSIVNKTATSGSVAGKTASIESTKSLALDASKDILVQGGNVTAGTGASLKAGNNITFETVKVESSSGSVANGISEVKNIGSKLNVGGDLDLKSGGNTTFKGSDVDVAGNLNADVKGNFEVLAVQDQKTVTSQETRSGSDVGNGVYGTETTSTRDFTGTNKGSTLKVGGNMKVVADKATIQGSEVEAKGDLAIDAKKGIDILDGLDEKSVTKTTTTTSFGSVGSNSDAGADAASGSKNKKAGANASANAENNNDVKAVESSTRVQSKTTKTSVASTLKSGGNMSLKAAEGTVKVQGSNVDAGGDLEVDAKNVEVLTGRNEVIESDTTETNSVGMYQNNSATAEAGANANGNRGQAGASAEVNANSTSTFGKQKEINSTSAYSLKNSASTLKSGGNMKIKAQETAKFVGAEVESAGNLAIEAKDIVNEAAKDIETTSSSNSKETAGVYLEADVSGDAGAQGDASTSTGQAGANGSVEAGAGLRVAKESSTEASRKVTNKVNTFKAGGDITRKAENKIVDQGTQLEAGGSIEQSAKIIEDVAIHDEDTTTRSAENIDARIGATAGAGGGANASSTGSADAGGGAGMGAKASVEGGSSASSETTKTAVVSKYKAGKSITSTSTEKTTLVGTVFEAGDKVKLKAGELEYKAAEDSKTSSGKSDDYKAELKVGGDSVEANGSYSNTRSSANATTAKAGSIKAGNGIEIETTSGDTTLVGTKLDTQGTVDINSAGNVNLLEAKSTSSSSNSSLDASLSLSGSKDGGDKKAAGNASFGMENDTESSTSNTTTSISGAKVNITAKKDVKNASAAITSKTAPAKVKAVTGKVTTTKVQDSKTAKSTGVSATAGASGTSAGKSKK